MATGERPSEGVGAVRVELRSRPPAGYQTACAAPSIQLRFDPNGLVTTCCKSLQPLGHITRERLHDIWAGARRRTVVRALEAGDFSAGCQRCGSEIAQEGRSISYAAIHDEWSGHLTTDPESRRWPVRMEFNLSNACNLQCIQCDGESSSAIRLHREGRPALPKVYGDEFFEDLRDFLPHLDRIVFAGGEPFLGSENFRVWDLIAAEAPHIDCMVVTNATQWTPRIERLLEQIRFSFIFSIDGISKSTYESIRLGSDLDRVLENVDRFCAYADRVGTTVAVNHCLMPQNVHEFGDLLVWAEQHRLSVNVSVVRSPASASIAALPPDQIVAAHQALLSQDERVRPLLDRNLGTWNQELARLGSWADAVEARDRSTHTVLWFRCDGAGPHDDAEARQELIDWSADGQVHMVSVGADDVVRVADLVLDGVQPSLDGGPIANVTKAVTAHYGEMNDYEVLATSEDRVDAWVRFGDTTGRVVSVAMRDGAGWADEARLLLAFGGAWHDEAPRC